MFKEQKWVWWAIFGGILVVGFLLRLAQLTASDFWYDEAFTAIVIRAPWNDMWAYLAADKVHPPLYYLLLRSWVSLFGTTVTGIRGFSLLFGTAILPMVYAITQQLHLEVKSKRLFGLVMTAIFALSPFFVTYSVEARSYSFLAFLILLSVFFFLRMTEKLYTFSWSTAGFIATIIAIVLTHYVSILVILGYAVAYALLVMVDKKWFFDSQIWGNITKLLLLAWLGFTYLWHYFGLERLFEKANLGWIPQSDLSGFIRTIYVFLFGVDRQSLGLPTINQFSFALLPQTVGILVLLSSLVAIVFAIQKLLKRNGELKDLLILLSLGVIPLTCVFLASSLGLHFYVDRYVIGYGTMLLLAFGYAWWINTGKSFGYVLVGYALLLTLLVLPKNSTKYSDTYNTLRAYGDNVIVVAEDPLDFVVFKAYFGEGKVKLMQRDDKSYYNWALIPQSDEINKTVLQQGNLVVRSKYSDKVLPANFTKLQESGDFVIYTVEN